MSSYTIDETQNNLHFIKRDHEYTVKINKYILDKYTADLDLINRAIFKIQNKDNFENSKNKDKIFLMYFVMGYYDRSVTYPEKQINEHTDTMKKLFIDLYRPCVESLQNMIKYANDIKKYYYVIILKNIRQQTYDFLDELCSYQIINDIIKENMKNDTDSQIHDIKKGLEKIVNAFIVELRDSNCVTFINILDRFINTMNSYTKFGYSKIIQNGIKHIKSEIILLNQY